MSNELPGYDAWKTRLPPEPYCDDPDCTCSSEKGDKRCPIHGIDPDYAYEDRRERDA
jgi:hypothetical protein